jgi:hypothetical protein
LGSGVVVSDVVDDAAAGADRDELD